MIIPNESIIRLPNYMLSKQHQNDRTFESIYDCNWSKVLITSGELRLCSLSYDTFLRNKFTNWHNIERIATEIIASRITFTIVLDVRCRRSSEESGWPIVYRQQSTINQLVFGCWFHRSKRVDYIYIWYGHLQLVVLSLLDVLSDSLVTIWSDPSDPLAGALRCVLLHR